MYIYNSFRVLMRPRRCYGFIRNLKQSSSLASIRILGIETSCDDTGVAIVDETGKVLGESLYSQNDIHTRFGGVNPLIAYELHRDNIDKATTEALAKAQLPIKDIDAIAVTTKPGLLISLQVGVKFAKYLAKKYQKPIIPIHHMQAHALAARMYQHIEFPFLVLLISGGHSLLTIANGVNDFSLLGESRDNAPGEVMDKAARRMKLKYIPEYSTVAGGRAIEMAAQKAKNPRMFNFPIPLWKYRDCNFSFSGLKDSLERKVIEKEAEHDIMADGIIPEVNDLCASFQLAIAEHLVHRTERAMKFCDEMNLIPNNKTIVVSGGVACNNFIYESISFLGANMGYNVVRPPPNLCTDNGIMIGWNGIEKFKNNCDIMSDIALSDIQPREAIGRVLIDEVVAADIQVKIRRLKSLYKIYTSVLLLVSLFLSVLIQAFPISGTLQVDTTIYSCDNY